MKKIIGYTAGVYDMFHVGHLNILEQAKHHCDYLIVGVSTDELCMSYKSKKPIIPHDDRKKIVSSIKYVDEVIDQTDRDKFKAWEKIKFDILFVGDDWKGSDFFNELEKKFTDVGVSIIYLPHTDRVSSTILRDKIVERD